MGGRGDSGRENYKNIEKGEKRDWFSCAFCAAASCTAANCVNAGQVSGSRPLSCHL